MPVTAEHSQLLAAMARGTMPAPFAPIAKSRSDWQAPAGYMGKDATGPQSLADLVSCWLPGADHRQLLELARDASRDGLDAGFDDLAARWLNQEKLSRLSALIADAGFESPVYAWCYAIGQAFTAVSVALHHTAPRPRYPGADLDLSDDAVAINPENAPPLSDDAALWLR